MSEIVDAIEGVVFPDGEEPWNKAEYVGTLHLALVREAINNLGWATFKYHCQKCHFEWRVWMSIGIEGPPELKEKKLTMPCPFIIPCPAWPIKQDATDEEWSLGMDYYSCDGDMQHTHWGDDEEFSPRLIPDNAPRFVLPNTSFIGLPAGTLDIPMPALIYARSWHRDRLGNG